MSKAKLSELMEAFKLFDEDGDGMISVEELKSLIAKIGGDLAHSEAQALVKAADKDGNNLIDFEEFAKFWECLHGESEGEIRAEFERYDIDKSGYITLDEMKMVISKQFTGAKCETARAALERLDIDKDDKVSYPEFILAMKFKKK